MDTGRNLTRDLVLPTVLFAALGGMTWAVRGCSGYGASMGCLFAGVTWGAAWWFIARDPGDVQSRRYTSGWIILAMSVGFFIAGARGWMQWPSFFDGRLMTDAAKGEFVPISRAYGFLWLFIAGVPWAGIGACMLAWCGAERPSSESRIAARWTLRIVCGVAGYMLAQHLFETYPDVFLPLYKTISTRYQDLEANPTLKRLINDNRAAATHMGLYLGFLAFEIGRLRWKNIVLIVTVGLVNGLGWAAFQSWTWASHLFGNTFNWWRCWESSGGISIGVAYGVAYYLVNREMSPIEKDTLETSWGSDHPRLERFGAYLGLLLGLGLSFRNALKGWANIYLGNEDYWSNVLWLVFGPLLILGILWLVARTFFMPGKEYFEDDAIPHAYGIMWLVLILQNVCAQLVTGPKNNLSEVAFSIYYVVLFVITGFIVMRYQRDKTSSGQATVAGQGNSGLT